MQKHLLNVCVAVTLAVVADRALAAPAKQPASTDDHPRQGNVFGINLGWGPGYSTVTTVRMLGLARTLVGDWGYLRPGFSNYDDVNQSKRSIAMIRAHRLIPTGGGATPDKEFQEEGKSYPRLDPDGSMRSAARARAAHWARMYRAGVPLYCVEVMNEVNVGNGWPAEKYAQYLYDFAVEVKKAYPGLKVCSAGMAGSGAGYYDKMLKFKPELMKVIDFWGLHPYPANHPPEYGPEGVALRSYVETAAVLEKYGVDPIRLMCTETGYELEIGDVGKDTAYPPIREDNRAEYMPRVFTDYYVPDPRIEMVSPFMLWDLPWHGWDGWNFMDHDARPKPMYYSVAKLPKTGGKDWLPTGDGRITGRITWADTDIGIPRVIVSVEPNFYGGVTDDEGNYEITDLPAGKYRIYAFADGFTGANPRPITVDPRKPARFDAAMRRVSLVPHSFDVKDPHPHSWSPIRSDLNPRTYRLDDRVRFNNLPTLRATSSTTKEFGLWRYGGYNSAYPNEVYVAEIFVRSLRTRIKDGGGPYLELDLANGRGEILADAKVQCPDFKADGKWHRITAALLAPPRSSRVRLTFGVKNASGAYWFSTPFVGEADFPLPSDTDYRTAGYVPPLYEQNTELFAQTIVDIKKRNPDLKTVTVTGRVTGFNTLPIAGATVATDSPVFVAVTDEDGRYSLTLPADEEMHVRAFAPGEVPLASDPIKVARGKSMTLDLTTAAPPAPEKLVNPGFNKYTKDAAGLLHGWTSFGATDGTVPSTKVYFEIPSYEGAGLYFSASNSNVKNGGALQVVQAEPGKKYRMTTQIYTRTEGGGKNELDNNCRIGIDPFGGRDEHSENIVWSEPAESDLEWSPVSVEATARTERLTVFIRHEMRRAHTWNICCFDDVQLKKFGR